MAWIGFGACGGEFQEKLVHQAGAGASWDATRVQTGASAIKLATDSDSSEAYLCSWNGIHPQPGEINVHMGYVGLPGAPSAEMGLLTSGADAQGPPTAGSNRPHLRIGTDRKLRLYDITGSLVLGPTTGVIPTTGLVHVAIIIVEATYPGNAWGKDYAFIYINGSEDVYGDVDGLYSTTYCWWGEYVVSARGADLYLDDCVSFRTGDAGHAPWVAGVPLCNVLAQFPAADGTYETGWIGDPDNTDKFNNWDDSELPEHDGDTSINYANTTDDVLTSEGESRATVGMAVDDTIAACIFGFVHRTVGANKFGGGTRVHRDGNNTDQSMGDPGDTYLCNTGHRNIARPGGGTWIPADLDDVEMGFLTDPDEHAQNWRVTVAGLIWPHYSATLGLATAPPGVSHIKALSSVAWASVDEVIGVAEANVKKVSGVQAN